MPGMGRDSWGSIVPESVYGTNPATGFSYFQIIDETMTHDQSVNISPSLRGASPRNTFLGNKKVGGAVKVELLYQGLNRFIKHALGAYSFTADTPVAGANTHGFSLVDALPTGFTMEICKGNTPSGKVFLYTGCKINALEIAIEPEQPLIMTAEIIAQTEAENTTASGTPTYPAYHPILWRHTGTLTLLGTSALEYKKGKIRIENNLALRHLMHDTTREPLRDALRVVSGEFTREFENLTLYSGFKTPTTGTLYLLFTSNEFAVGTTPFTFAISGPKVQLQPPKVNVNGTGIIEATFPFIALHSGVTDDQIIMSAVNSEATLA
jgi:hypothetical protein